MGSNNTPEIVEELAMLYLKNQDLSLISPEQLCELYLKAIDKIEKRYSEYRPSGKQQVRY